ncbi:hypothetical protein Xen7305DRAFT_00023990 [Xenococcus sp. PCC 7305]|uniref:hypothetical protein n=1 Tax=Xenococcus sp. PCC 7305 TaxID=102125 RepID=UPI0002ABD52D|nr:hypothetical protein [Xenococcus sp. PCC 7305]ELS02681.1 hypothetical protein Xen7305DRAFT_00023990 [Xenococcus sp. PCC 7305]
MLGNFQQSQLRIELEAKQSTIRDSLINTKQLEQWIWPQTLSANLPETLSAGLKFTSKLAFLEIEYLVKVADDNCLRLILSNGIDGYQEWCWGDGWMQSRLEGITLLPLELGQTYNLMRLRQHIEMRQNNKE